MSSPGSAAINSTVRDFVHDRRRRPEYIRSDNGAEFTAKAAKEWLADLEVAPLYIEPGSRWENGYVESFNGKMRDEFLNRERLYTLKEAQVLIEQWIRWSAIGLSGEENDVSTMISNLASLLRLSLESDENIIPLAAEIQHADLFVRILKARYPRKIKVEWDIDENLTRFAVLKLCLQPIIENAYYHGIKPMRRSGTIHISGQRDGQHLRISISDDGKGLPSDRLAAIQQELQDNDILKEDHIGIVNVHQRIKLVFGEEYGIDLRSTESQGTTVSLLFPEKEM